jgi:hypothetical protein
MNPIPKLLDSIDADAYAERLKTDTPTYTSRVRGYEIVYSLVDEKPADFVRAMQEEEILKTRIKVRTGSILKTLPSFWEVWHDRSSGLSDEIAKHPDPHEAKWELSRKYGYKLATTFMPSYAKCIYEYFGAKCVLDPCAGWGDRLVGATVSTCVKKYVGFDPNRALIPGYKRIMHHFGHEEKTQTIFSFLETESNPVVAFNGSVATHPNANAQVAFNGSVATQTHVAFNGSVATQTHVAFNNEFEIYAEPFENGILSFPPASFDFAFTSPPYFDYEDYSPSNPIYKDWIREFYTPLFRETARVLKSRSFFAIHIGDTSAGQIQSFLDNVPHQFPFRYVSKIGLVGAHSKKIRNVHLFQKTT